MWRTDLSPGLTCLAVRHRRAHLICESPWAQDCTSGDSARGLGWIRTNVKRGQEIDAWAPKAPLQSKFATSPWSHPLESNQNLSVFSRARRPHAQEWVTSVMHLCASRRSSSSSSVVRERPPCAGRTSGRNASAFWAGAPFAIRDLLFRSRVAKTRLCISVARNAERAARFPWRPFRHVGRVTSRHSWGEPPVVPGSRS